MLYEMSYGIVIGGKWEGWVCQGLFYLGYFLVWCLFDVLIKEINFFFIGR